MPWQSAFAHALEVKKDDIYIVGEKNCPYNCEAHVSYISATKLIPDQMDYVDGMRRKAADGSGFIIDIIKAIYEPLGHRVVYKTMSQKRAKTRFAAGRYNILLNVKKLKKKNDDYLFSTQSIGQTGHVFFTHANTNWRYYGDTSLEMVTLGLVNGQKYPELAAYIEANKSLKLRLQFVDAANAAEALDLNMRKLAKGRISAIYADKYSADFYRKNMELEDTIIDAGELQKTKPLFLAFSPSKTNSKELIKDFDKGIAELRKSGKLAEILDKYGIKDWKN